MFGGPASGRWRLLPCAANGEAGFGLYQRSAEGGDYQSLGLSVVSLASDGPAVTGITIFLDPALAPRFGLPERLPQGGRAAMAA
jgi:RNA polymerase sigma-70 factor (ECF subfamily)